MPFESKAQQRYMFAQHPDIAKRWAAQYGVPANLPEHAPGKSKLKRKGKKRTAREMAVARLAVRK